MWESARRLRAEQQPVPGGALSNVILGGWVWHVSGFPMVSEGLRASASSFLRASVFMVGGRLLRLFMPRYVLG